MKMFHNHVVKLKCKRQCVSITTNCHKWRIAQSKVVKLVTKKCIFAKLVFPKILHQLNVEFWYTPRRPISDASRTWKNITSDDESTVSKRLTLLGMIQKQGRWVPYELKPRDVERRCVTCELLLQCRKKRFFTQYRDWRWKVDTVR